MAESVRARVFAALEDRLRTVAGASVHYAPLYDLAPEDLPAVALVPGGEDAADLASDTLDMTWRATVGVAAGAPGVTTAEAGRAIFRALDALRAEVRAALAADPTLAGLVSAVRYTGADDPVFVEGPGGRAAYAVMILGYDVEGWEGEADPAATV